MHWIRTYNNFQINNIIKYKVRDEWIYSKITKVTKCTLRVINLNIIENKYFIENNTINPITKNSIALSYDGKTRRAIYKLQ